MSFNPGSATDPSLAALSEQLPVSGTGVPLSDPRGRTDDSQEVLQEDDDGMDRDSRRASGSFISAYSTVANPVSHGTQSQTSRSATPALSQHRPPTVTDTSVYESATEGGARTDTEDGMSSARPSFESTDTVQKPASIRSTGNAQAQQHAQDDTAKLNSTNTATGPQLEGDAIDNVMTPRHDAVGTFASHASTVRPTAATAVDPVAARAKDEDVNESERTSPSSLQPTEDKVVAKLAQSKEKQKKDHKKSDKKGRDSDSSSSSSDSDSDEVTMNSPELAKLNEEERKIVLDQIHVDKRPPVKFTELFRYATKFEVMLNGLGLVAAIVSGATQPLMTVVFGALTSAFTNYSLATVRATQAPGAEAQAALDAARDNLFSEVNKDVLYLVYIGIGMLVTTFVYMATWIYTGERITRRVREEYLSAVLRQNIAYFDKLGAGEVTTRIETDTHLVQEGISDKVPISVMFMSTFVTGFIIAYVRNWRLALAMSSIIPCIAIAGAVMQKFLSRYKLQMLEETAKGSTLAEEVISSVRNTHAFATQKKLAQLYDNFNLQALNTGLRSAFANGVGLGVFFFVIYASYGLAFYFGTTLILSGDATSGAVVNVFFSILIGAFSLAQLAPNLQSVSYAVAAAGALYTTIDRVPPIDSSSAEGDKPDRVHGDIELKGVNFIYPSRPGVQVLYDFSGIFPRGKMTALVGGSGSGKSTIIGLVERFYDPISGSITLDGREVKSLNVRWLRSQIGLVSQEPTLFATTVAGNIEHGLIGKFENDTAEQRRARVVEAAIKANADGFISALPQGYDTMIGERGMLLSGGQKQRIAIARAIVGDPQILLLDEATSALDTNSEAIVQEALDRASHGRTTITIAHRLSTIKDADQIIVLTAGRILESALTNEKGTAHELLLQNPDGPYSRLVSAQKFREQEEAKADQNDQDSDSASVSVEKPVAVPGELSKEQAEEIARNEKPAFGTLRRMSTGRSAASIVLEEKRQRDAEEGKLKERQHGLVYLIARLLKLNKEFAWQYLLALAAAIVCGTVYPAFSIVFGGVVGGVFSLDPVTQRDELRSGGNQYALYCFIISLVSTAAITVCNYFFGSTAEYLSRTLRLTTFGAILRQDISFFDKDENSTGHLTSTISDWAQKIQGLLGVTAGVIIQSIATIISGAIIGLCYAPKIAAVGIACIPLTLSAGFIRLRVVVLKDQKNKKSHEQSAQMACEAASAIRTVASLTREDDCNRIYSEYLERPMIESNRTALISNAYYSLSQSLSFWVIGLVFWYGSRQLASNDVSARSFFVAMISVVFGSIQAGNIFSFVPDMSKARGAAAAAIQLYDSRPEIDAESIEGDQLASCSGRIAFKNVHFRYPTRPHVRVLRGLDMEVQPGQFVAVVGASGAGKSTIVQLIERFYDPLSGTIEVDGHDISELNINNYRSHVSLVSQEPTLYAGSVKFNITLGANKPADQVTDDEVVRACKDANIHDFIVSLPDGYETEVGGKGTQLSGGQKQRLAIARALVRDPKILLLDEATSALDSESEKVVQAALDKAAKGRSTIAVAHRLSTIQAADVIYVLKDGRVAEKGKHFELLALKGLYHELVAQQDLERHG
ncbi:hypothetical protein OIO90_003993 [Microbotryomycetes sp. JL221]|nr:hypothetical protein OIO90_003993 [Microbotryomycetes sp. JL221]